jgi:cell division transport system permease protein
MKVWLRQHAFALSDAIRHIAVTAGSFTVNALVVAISLALPIAGLTLLENVRPLSEQLSVAPEISVFMSVNTPREQAVALAPQIRRIVQSARSTGQLEFIPKESALRTMKNRSGLSDALTTLGINPLPDGYVLKLAGFDNAAEASRVDAMAAQLKALPGVEYVQVDSAWVKRLAALMNLLRLALGFLAAALAVVVVAVIFNTIRLQVLTQRDEIDISRMFGATDAYICRPFYYTGALLGLVAGAAGLAIVGVALYPLNSAIAEFARLYASEFRLHPLSAAYIAALLATSGCLGLIGAALSVRRHLTRSF